MIISRTPFRISFFGGGTDYPVWYEQNGGAVLGSTIDKYCYITCRYLPPFFDHKFRVAYSTVEHAHNIDEIDHPSVRECLRHMEIQNGLEIHHDGDLPARAGIGSSSAFTVGMIHGLYALKGIEVTKHQLALEAIHVEQDLIRETVGSQDQTFAAFGGLNLIEFGGPEKIQVNPVRISESRKQLLQDHLLMLFTGFSRNASEVAAVQVQQTPKKSSELKAMHQMVLEGLDILDSERDVGEFGQLLDEGWHIKRTLSNRISTSAIDEIYASACEAGAIGGKLIGAGGGGFMILFARPEHHDHIKERLRSLLFVPFKFEDEGSQIIFRNQDFEPTSSRL